MALQRSSDESNVLNACWTDETGVVHTCESAEPLGGELLVWTLCDREVESGATHVPALPLEVTCSKCIAAKLILDRRGAHYSTLTA
jgi:hypothetical protein